MPEVNKKKNSESIGNTFADKAVDFFLSIKMPESPDASVEFINPYDKTEVRQVLKSFFTKYYNDSKERVFLIGINPGRFGGGLTGISFTDPVALRKYCEIENNFGSQRELSSEFVYLFINKFGGPERFFSKFFLTALYPLAIVKDGKNYNYYDDNELYLTLKPDIINSLNKQIGFGANKNTIICLGRRNERYLNELNQEFKFFGRIITLDHPRYIMQYKRKALDRYLNDYVGIFNQFKKLIC